MKALDSVDRLGIQELKSYNDPPDLVKFVLKPLCLMFGKECRYTSFLRLPTSDYILYILYHFLIDIALS